MKKATWVLLVGMMFWMGSNGEPLAGLDVEEVTLGVILPYTSFGTIVWGYKRKLSSTIEELIRQSQSHPALNFSRVLKNVKFEMMMWPISPNPIEILKSLCNVFLPKNVSALLYVTTTRMSGSEIAASQYFFQLVNYLGIPILAWNADNSGLGKKLSNSMVLQLAPTTVHQASAMLSILIRYKWHQFSVVTTQLAGHGNFIQAIRERIMEKENEFKLKLLEIVKVNNVDDFDKILDDLHPLKTIETRIVLLYATNEEATKIFEAANFLNLFSHDYLWIVTESVVGRVDDAYYPHFPIGLLGIHFDTGKLGVERALANAVRVFGNGLELFLNSPSSQNISMQSSLSCLPASERRWENGIHLHKYFSNVSFSADSLFEDETNVIEFNADGTLRYTTFEIVNLNEYKKWKKVGTWHKETLYVHDIVWPGESPFPPLGKPEQFKLTVAFLEEPPFLNMEMVDPATGECSNPGVRCRIPPAKDGYDPTGVAGNDTYYQCCTGFCVDLLTKLSEDLDFTFELKRVEDGQWGSEVNGTWIGLIEELLSHKADIAMTALKINSQRESVVDFSVPFMETGIAIVVAKRTGLISAQAFLGPFDLITWIFVLVVCVQAVAIAIFMFEWFSPAGFDMKNKASEGHEFSLFRTLWLVWAILFGASVNVNSPRGYTARFMANVWAGFKVVFLAIYTANLAASFITREEYYNLAGIEDHRLILPLSHHPPFKFGTVPFGNTDTILKNNFPGMHRYMTSHNKSSVNEGVAAVKKGELDAFLYDATVLEYLVGQDEECRLLTVGAWYAMTGYGIAFPRHSRYLDMFNQQLLEYSRGELEQWQKFWLTGACKPKEDQSNKKFHSAVSLEQFMSTFVLLGSGVLLAALLLGLEKFYFKYLKRLLQANLRMGRCCNLISLNVGRSLSLRETVYEARDLYKNHKCSSPICDTPALWKTRYQLDMARLKIEELEAELRKKSQIVAISTTKEWM